MAVDGGAGDVEQVGDLLDCVVTGVLELLGKFCLAGGEFGPAAAGATASPGSGEAVAGVGHDQLAFAARRGRRACRIWHGPRWWRCRCPLLDDVQAHAALMQVGAEVRVV